MTTEELHVLQHSIGADKFGQGGGYRNHFCAGGIDVPICQRLVEQGLMVQHETTQSLPYFNCSVTESGKQAVIAESPKPPKLSRSQRRYREFLAADNGDTFKEWLLSRKGAPDAEEHEMQHADSPTWCVHCGNLRYLLPESVRSKARAQVRQCT